MRVQEPMRTPPVLPNIVKETLVTVEMSEAEVRSLLTAVDEKKAVGPEKISPHLLCQFAAELAYPVTTLFNSCLSPPYKYTPGLTLPFIPSFYYLSFDYLLGK